jgi:hypothetical protein
MWHVYKCVFGCGATHKEISSSEALAYWYGVHQSSCTAVKELQDV